MLGWMLLIQRSYSNWIGKYNATFYARAEEQKSCIALAPSEGEYVGMSEVGKAFIGFRNVLAAIRFSQLHPEGITIFKDSDSAINLAKGPSIQRKSKHIMVREHYIRDLIAQKYVNLEQIRSTHQQSDLFTIWCSC